MKKKLFQMKTVFICLLFVGALLAASEIFAQQRQLSGKVIDETGDPVIGASVLVVGTNIGTAIGLDGTFSLNVPVNATILVSFIGYISQTIPVGDRTYLDVILVEDIQALDEVVVIGYGVQRKSDLTGSVSRVSSDDMQNRTVTTATDALLGKTAGVSVLTLSGAPGASSEIRVRGFSSNSSSAPLYVVDGLTVPNIDYLEPMNIESIEVLKDAASAAIYGAQAGNGVVLVTTKTGARNTVGKLSYNMLHTLSNVSNIPDAMNAQQWTEYMLEGGFTDQGALDNYWYVYKNGTKADTRWSDYLYEQGKFMRHNVGFTGGNDKGNLFVSLTYTDNDGIIMLDKDQFNRLTAQINADYQIKPWIKIGVNNSVEKYERKTIVENSGVRGLTAAAVLLDPITPYLYEMDNLPSFVQGPYDEGKPFITDKNGVLYGTSPYATSEVWHPMQMLLFRDDKVTGVNTNGTLFADFTPVKGLVFTTRFGYRYTFSNLSSYTSPFYINAVKGQENGTLEVRTDNTVFYQWDNFANYSFSFDKHNFTAMAGMSYQKHSENYVRVTTDLLTNEAENFRYLHYSSTTANDVVYGFPTDVVSLSYFGRLTWSYDNRYNLQANFRADAYDASRLSKESRWGYFPSISGGWTLSNEEFMRDIDNNTLSFLKLRASYGVNGNINILRSNTNTGGGYYYATSLVTTNVYNIDSNSGTIIGTSPSTTLANPTLRWEESVQVGIGLDLRLLRDRLAFTYDFYRKTTEGLLTSSVPSMITGTSTTYVNAGNVRNIGHEFELTWKDTKKDFRYSISANLATLDNLVVKGPSTTRIAGASGGGQTITYFEEGYPVWYFRTYRVDHIDPATGTTIYKTADGGTTTDPTNDDRVYSGSGIPDFTYGLTINLAYKGFDMVLFGSGSQGGNLFQAYYRVDLPAINRLNLFYTDRWTPTNTNATRPKPNVADTRYWSSDALLFDASYFKIRQIQLGYTVPRQYLNQVNISSLRVYISADNLFTFTKYPGVDPEARNSSTSGFAIDSFAFPTSKNLGFGLNLEF